MHLTVSPHGALCVVDPARREDEGSVGRVAFRAEVREWLEGNAVTRQGNARGINYTGVC